MADAPSAAAFEETRDQQDAFPRLSDDAIAALEERGAGRPTSEGELLFREGYESYGFFVVLSGQVAIVADLGRPDERVIGVHGKRRFLGEMNLLTGEGVYLSARVVEPGELIQVPAARLRELVTGQPGLGDLILGAYLARRAILIGLGTGPRRSARGSLPTRGACAFFSHVTACRTASSTSRRTAAPRPWCASSA
jgi:thioredoxin reductase (NADPH)